MWLCAAPFGGLRVRDADASHRFDPPLRILAAPVVLLLEGRDATDYPWLGRSYFSTLTSSSPWRIPGWFLQASPRLLRKRTYMASPCTSTKPASRTSNV